LSEFPSKSNGRESQRMSSTLPTELQGLPWKGIVVQEKAQTRSAALGGVLREEDKKKKRKGIKVIKYRKR